jgi:hypothetical protein
MRGPTNMSTLPGPIVAVSGVPVARAARHHLILACTQPGKGKGRDTCNIRCCKTVADTLANVCNSFCMPPDTPVSFAVDGVNVSPADLVADDNDFANELIVPRHAISLRKRRRSPARGCDLPGGNAGRQVVPTKLGCFV